MTPHAYCVVLVGQQRNLFARENRRDFLSYVQLQNEVRAVDDFHRDISVYWADDDATAELLIASLTRLFPMNTYAKCKTEVVVGRTPGPVTRSRFTEQGFMPE